MDIRTALVNYSGASLLNENDQFAVLSKRHSIHSVSNYSGQPSLANDLCNLVPDLAFCSPKPLDAGLVQRLDYETSGCILLAKSLNDWNLLRQSLSTDTSKKTYLVLLDGTVHEETSVAGWIGSPYRRSKKVQFKLRVNSSQRFLWSESVISPLLVLPEANITFAEVSTITARRHQVRVHCASLGSPLIGDSLYGSTRKLSDFGLSEDTPNFILHAERLTFMWNNQITSFFASFPSYINTLSRTLGFNLTVQVKYPFPS